MDNIIQMDGILDALDITVSNPEEYHLDTEHHKERYDSQYGDKYMEMMAKKVMRIYKLPFLCVIKSVRKEKEYYVEDCIEYIRLVELDLRL